MDEIMVPVTIIGGGGCGLTSSCLLSDHGVEHLLLERHDATSILPKAHYLNQRTMEIFRRHGIASAVADVGAPLENFGHVRWVTSLGGDGPLDRKEFYEADAFGGGTLTERYRTQSPIDPTNLPQLRLEPILRKIAEERAGDHVRFGHELVDWIEEDDGLVLDVRNRGTGQDYRVRTSYLIAADGGKTVVPKLGIQMVGPTEMLEMVSTHFRADLSEFADDRSLITWSINPEGEGTWSSGALVKMGPTWDRHSEEWVIHFAFRPDDPERFDESAIVPRLRQLLKLPDLDIEVLKVSHWILDRVVAERFRQDRIFLAGDAAHRQPPTTGLGLNSAIQDADNLCWKLAARVNGFAGEALLDTYEAERQPVSIDNADWALSAFTNVAVIDSALGIVKGAPVEQNIAAFQLFFSETRIGRSQRARFSEVIRTQRIEFEAQDVELGFCYETGALVADGTPPVDRDPIGGAYQPSTRPGSRLPHAWIEVDGERMSTHDLAPVGSFLVIAGSEGSAWRDAAEEQCRKVGIPLMTYVEGTDFDDTEGAWGMVSGIGSGGAILVRPDSYVAWRVSDDVAGGEFSDALESIIALKSRAS